jgi:plastocyanin
MKIFYALSFFVVALSFQSQAVKHIVTQSGFTFNPNAITVNVGDTVRWEWTDGSHTTTSILVPTGADTWDSPLNSNNTFFEYEVLVAGSYGYKCTPHFGQNMIGGFLASAASSVKEVVIAPTLTVSMDSQNNELFLNLTAGNGGFAVVKLIDISGRVVSTLVSEEIGAGPVSLKRDVSSLGRGIYFVHMKVGDRELTKKFIKG